MGNSFTCEGICLKIKPPPGVSEDEFDLFEQWTFFTKWELRKLHVLWKKMVPKESAGGSKPRASLERLTQMKQLEENPFAKRIFVAFAGDKSGHLTFDEFVDCFSHFHPQADKEAKLKLAFRIYDYNFDGLIGTKDVEQLLKTAVGSDIEKYQLTLVDFETIADRVIEEADMDGSGYLGFTEFKKIMGQVDEFESNFSITLF